MADLVARESDIIRTISPNEAIPAEDIEIYLSAARSALECINVSLHAVHKSASDVRRILDLPCGHGSVLRHVRATFPAADITACDIMREGVDFCVSTFGALPVYSHADPAGISLEHNAFDLIWVGSLFAELNVDLWSSFLSVSLLPAAPMWSPCLFDTRIRPLTQNGYGECRRKRVHVANPS